LKLYAIISKSIKNIQKVFSNWSFLTIAAITTICFWIIFTVLDGLLFFYPSFTFWIPTDATINFILSTITSILIGLVISMNLYFIFNNYNTIDKFTRARNKCKINIRNNNKKENKNSLYSLSISPILAIFLTGCISCSSSLGLFTITSIASILGVGTATAFTSFMSEYQFPIRMVTLGILVWSFGSINKSITNSNLDNIENNNLSINTKQNNTNSNNNNNNNNNYNYNKNN
jgi:hypothetical protein